MTGIVCVYRDGEPIERIGESVILYSEVEGWFAVRFQGDMGEPLLAQTLDGARLLAQSKEIERLTALNTSLHSSLERYDAEAFDDVLADRDEWQRRAERAIHEAREWRGDAEMRRLELTVKYAELERVKPVLDAARALRHGRDSCEPGWTWAKYYANLANFDAVVDEHDAAGPGGCAGHTRKSSEIDDCVCSSTSHDYNGITVKELNPDADCPIHGEKACSGCGGLDGTHTVRDCAGHTKVVAEPSGGIGERTMAAVAAYARATGMVPSDPAAEGLSSTDATAAGDQR